MSKENGIQEETQTRHSPRNKLLLPLPMAPALHSTPSNNAIILQIYQEANPSVCQITYDLIVYENVLREAPRGILVQASCHPRVTVLDSFSML